MSNPSPHRLPRSVTPARYELRLAPDLDAATFSGEVRIDAEVHEPTTTVVLDAAELEVTAATVAGRPASVHLDASTERLTLALDEPLTPGPVTLHLVFTGELNDRLRGFYRSTFTDTDGVTRTIATTQFESTNARRAFPCWDEPDLKAVFEITLDVPADLLAVSCGRQLSRHDLGNGTHRVQFAPTMVLSTYLLAFVVGPMEATEARDVDGISLRVIHPVGKGHLATFALECGAFCLRHFARYFAIPYPGDKLDLVAVPDFAFGAMENMGCVTFREVLLLIDPDNATQPELERAADVIAHEIAHMWFGNLVTMGWWEGIWLKEAFATFCEMHAVDAYRPDWERWLGFGLSRTAAFDTDALASTRSIEYEVHSPEDAEAMYDVLTYEKGAAVVRMLEQYLGPEVFQRGTTEYLRRHSYANTVTADLWDAYELVSGEPMRATMDSWIYQEGFPVITVATDGADVHLSQRRFRFDQVDDTTRWHVPVIMSYGRDGAAPGEHRLLLQGQVTTVTLDASPRWLVANPRGSGFYRVRYEGAARDALINHRRELSAFERYGLVDDSWAAVLAGLDPVQRHLDLVAVLATDEDDLAVWQRIVATLHSIDHHLTGTERAGSFRQWCRSQLGPALAALDNHAEPGHERDLQRRATLVESLGRLGEPDWISAAATLVDDPAAPAAMRAAAVNIMAAHGTGTTFEDFVSRFRHASTPQEERRFLFALADFPGGAEAAHLVELVDNGTVRSQDVPLLLARALANAHTGRQVWGWVRDHWDELTPRLATNTIGRIVTGTTALAEPDLRDDVHAFFATHPLPQAGKTLDQNLERLRINVGVRQRLRAELAEVGAR
jgi:puromycin-sensitive aminopeptidase